MNFRLANSKDDDAINYLLQQTHLDGMFRISYLREPSFLASMNIQGSASQVIVGEKDGRVHALATCSTQNLYVGGRKHKAGYIGNVRIHPKAREGYTFFKGFNYFKSLQLPGKLDFYYTSLIADDKRSLALFTQGRAGIPKPVDRGKIITYLLPLKRKSTSLAVRQPCEIRVATDESMYEVMAFLNKMGSIRDFFPVLEKLHPQLLQPENFFVAYFKSEIVGVLAVFNLQKHKQYWLQSYAPLFNVLRWPLSRVLNLKGLYSMPKPGTKIQMGMLGFPLVKNNDTSVFEALLAYIYTRFSGRDMHYLTLSLHEKDPLNTAMKTVSKIRYESRLYVFNLMDSTPIDLGDENIKTIPFIDLPRL